MKGNSKTVTFRLSGLQWQRLAEAADMRGVSPGEYARRVLLDALDGNADRSEKALDDLASQLRQMHLALGRATLVLLVDAGKCGEKDAREWVTREILGRAE